jgi:hypothetical protein
MKKISHEGMYFLYLLELSHELPRILLYRRLKVVICLAILASYRRSYVTSHLSSPIPPCSNYKMPVLTRLSPRCKSRIHSKRFNITS